MAQQPLTFELERVSDSLSWLCLYPKIESKTALKRQEKNKKSRTAIAKWRLPYPVYRLVTGDINGDGKDEAIVGVIKPTRFYPQPARRLFIFKQINGKIRPCGWGREWVEYYAIFVLLNHTYVHYKQPPIINTLLQTMFGTTLDSLSCAF